MNNNFSVVLNKGAEKRLLKGHKWVFSNEIGKVTNNPQNGEIVNVFSFSNSFLCKGFFNKNSLIAVRILSTTENEIIDSKYLRNLIINSNNRRLCLSSSTDSYRMINGESDGLPGLIIDKYVNNYSIQIFSVGFEKLLNAIRDILIEDFNAELIIAKNDNILRELEGLEKYEKILYSKNSDSEKPFISEIGGIKYQIDLIEGQKTGYYLDQEDNRRFIRRFINNNSKVLDLYCNQGGFSLNCSIAGAEEVLGIDSSEKAIRNAIINSKLNQLNGINFLQADVFDYLKSNQNVISKYNMFIVDPPSFTKNKKSINSALNGYIKLHYPIFKNAGQNTLIFTFSCSQHIQFLDFKTALSKCAVKANREVQIIYSNIASPDHPVLLNMEETLYLKSILLRII
jgi:23S rRNA (cytosine1962-C5)-methyltransferase